jgi:4-hydroxy-3-methylbut-2-en-1-yl diphosphate synthase IspG/GcpE
VQVAQLIVLILALVGTAMMLGRRDADLASNTEQIAELRAICADLARVTGSLSTTDASHSAQLTSIERRLDRLEAR